MLLSDAGCARQLQPAASPAFVEHADDSAHAGFARLSVVFRWLLERYETGTGHVTPPLPDTGELGSRTGVAGRVAVMTALWLSVSLAPIAFAQPQFDPLYACEYTGTAKLAPGTFNAWKCQCGGGIHGDRNEDYAPVCIQPKAVEDDAALRKELRCLFDHSPSKGEGHGEAAAWVIKGECGFELAYEKQSQTAEVALSCPGPDQVNLVAHANTHSYLGLINGRLRAIGVEPSSGTPPSDRNTAQVCKRPIYVLTEKYVWVAYPKRAY